MSAEHVTSTGHDLSDPAWQDQHFNFSREAYEAMVRWFGIQPGWHVLDAGCGIGSYLPWFAEMVGPTGRLSALDLAPENVTTVEGRFKAKPLACPVEAREGSVLALPYDASTFDAIWTASVSQYLTDDELRQMLAEFRRVVKPSGLVAVKEFHLPGTYESLIPPLVNWHFHDAMCNSGNKEWQGIMRADELPTRLRAAGMTDVRFRFFSVEKRGPLNANDRAFRISACKWFAEQAAQLNLQSEDHEVMRRLSDEQYVSAQLNDSDYFTHREYIQVVGRVP